MNNYITIVKIYEVTDQETVVYFPMIKELNYILPLADWNKPTGAKFEFNYAKFNNYLNFTSCDNASFAIIPISNYGYKYNGLQYISNSPDTYSMFLTADVSCNFLFYINNLLKAEGSIRATKPSVIMKFPFTKGLTISIRMTPKDNTINNFNGLLALAI
jgi:hypothetical protein